MRTIILASRSVDRRELFKRLAIPFKTLITDINEEQFKKKIEDPIKLVMKLAEFKARKAKEILRRKNTKDDTIVIAADTIVQLQDEIIGKAKNKEQAFTTIKKLNNKTHNLITGIAITQLNNSKLIVDYDKTLVSFLPLSEEEIHNYLANDEWEGRAGAYSINDKASMFIEKIEGSPSNVAGLPIQKIFKILKNEFDLNLLEI